MRYNHFSMLPEEAFKPRNGRYGMTLEGGGDSPPPPPTQTSQISIPEYAQPYMERLLGKAEAATEAPRQIYGGERFAGATPQQAQARFEASQMQTPGQFGVGTGMVGAAGLRALGTQYQPGRFAAREVAGPDVTQFQMGETERFGGAQAQQYMDPYMQQVVDIQKRKAIEDAKRAQLGANLGAVRQGTYGGARQLLAQGERERGLSQQLGDIQAMGSQAAFQQAQQQFERDRVAQQAAQQANLQAQLETQRLGVGTSLEAQRANQQAMMELQKLAEQSRQFGGELGLRGTAQAIEAGKGLAQIGQTEQAAELERLKAQEAFGSLTQADRQRMLDLQYQDFMAQQQFPFTQMSYMADILRGIPGRSVYEYQQQPSGLQQMVGPGLLGLGMYREFMR
jgi:hypothetical protein